MKYKVIAPFRDNYSGDLVQPGDPLPKRLDEDAISRLVTARCVAPLKAKTAKAPPPKTGAGETSPKQEAGGGAPGLFPDAGGSPLAGGDGGADRQRAEPDSGSGPGGPGDVDTNEDDSGQ